MPGLIATHHPVLASAARTADGQSNSFKVKSAQEILLFLEATEKTGTTPTLDVTVETAYDDQNGPWFELDTFTKVEDAPEKQVKRITGFGLYLRVSYKFGGTDTPGYTFRVDMVKKEPAR